MDPAQLSSLGLPQLTEVILRCLVCGLRARVGSGPLAWFPL